MLDPKSEPVRIAYVVLSAALAILAILGVTEGTAVEVLGQIVVLIGGGEAVRSKVSPVKRGRRA